MQPAWKDKDKAGATRMDNSSKKHHVSISRCLLGNPRVRQLQSQTPESSQHGRIKSTLDRAGGTAQWRRQRSCLLEEVLQRDDCSDDTAEGWSVNALRPQEDTARWSRVDQGHTLRESYCRRMTVGVKIQQKEGT